MYIFLIQLKYIKPETKENVFITRAKKSTILVEGLIRMILTQDINAVVRPHLDNNSNLRRSIAANIALQNI